MTIKEKINFINKDIMPTGCSGQCPSMTGGNKDAIPLDTREGSEYDNLESFSCHSRAQTRESRNKDTMTLDARVKHEYDNADFNSINKDAMPLDIRVKPEYDKAETFPLSSSDSDTYTLSPLDNNTSSLSHSGERSISPFLSFPCLTRESRSHECRMENGRSMVEMLGVLAVIGVLSIGGIAGYSYGMDKYRANETTNQIMLRAIDLMTQAGNNNETLSFASWNNEASQYDFGTPEYTNDGLIVFDVGINEKMPKRICEIVYDAMKDMAVQIDINATRADSNDTCGDDNEMSFYFEGQFSYTCEPACDEGEYCDNGICFTGPAPEGTKVFGGVCENESDCAECQSCSANKQCFVDFSDTSKRNCILENGKEGYCFRGKCIEKGSNSCTQNENCPYSTYCHSPNTNSDNCAFFSDNQTGTCEKINFGRVEIKGSIYYTANSSSTWWNAKSMCDSMGKDLIGIDDLFSDWDGYKTDSTHKYTFTDVGKELQKYIGAYVWTKDTYDSCQAWYMQMDGTFLSYLDKSGTVADSCYAVCK